MDPIFTEEQLNRMSREDMLSLVKMMQDHYQKTGNKDPDPGSENKGTGIPERNALPTALPLLRGNALAHPVKNMRTGIPS